MIPKPAAAAALLLCSLASGSALAAASASASLTGFSMTFNELGIGWFYSPPLIWVDSGAALNYSSVLVKHAENGVDVETNHWYSNTSGMFDPSDAATSTSNGLTQANASISGDGSYRSLGLAVAGFADLAEGAQAGDRDSFVAGTTRYYSHHDPFGNFLLRPYTEVVFSAWSSVAVQAGGAPGEEAEAGTSLLVTSLFGGADAGFQSSADSDSACSEFPGEGGICGVFGHDVSSSRLLSVRFSNPGPTVLSGRLDASAFATGYVAGITPSVPEPESYAMLLAGLGLIGIAIRRRDRRI